MQTSSVAARAEGQVAAARLGLALAAHWVAYGGVACPTEAFYGLDCDPRG